MGKRNKHGWKDTLTGGISKCYMQSELGPWVSCPKRSCGGTMTDIYVRYVDHGPIFKDQECTYCGKVRKDPCTFEYFKDINQFNRDLRKQKGSKSKIRRKRIFTNRVKLSKIDMLTNPRMQAALYGNWCKGKRILTPRNIAKPNGGQNATPRREQRGTKNRRFSKR
jgi:hypothetical protein